MGGAFDSLAETCMAVSRTGPLSGTAGPGACQTYGFRTGRSSAGPCRAGCPRCRRTRLLAHRPPSTVSCPRSRRCRPWLSDPGRRTLEQSPLRRGSSSTAASMSSTSQPIWVWAPDGAPGRLEQGERPPPALVAKPALSSFLDRVEPRSFSARSCRARARSCAGRRVAHRGAGGTRRAKLFDVMTSSSFRARVLPDVATQRNSSVTPAWSSASATAGPQRRPQPVGPGARQAVVADHALDHVGHHRGPGAARRTTATVAPPSRRRWMVRVNPVRRGGLAERRWAYALRPAPLRRATGRSGRSAATSVPLRPSCLRYDKQGPTMVPLCRGASRPPHRGARPARAATPASWWQSSAAEQRGRRAQAREDGGRGRKSRSRTPQSRSRRRDPAP